MTNSKSSTVSLCVLVSEGAPSQSEHIAQSEATHRWPGGDGIKGPFAFETDAGEAYQHAFLIDPCHVLRHACCLGRVDMHCLHCLVFGALAVLHDMTRGCQARSTGEFDSPTAYLSGAGLSWVQGRADCLIHASVGSKTRCRPRPGMGRRLRAAAMQVAAAEQLQPAPPVAATEQQEAPLSSPVAAAEQQEAQAVAATAEQAWAECKLRGSAPWGRSPWHTRRGDPPLAAWDGIKSPGGRVRL